MSTISNVTEMVRITAECVFCHITDSTRVPLARLQYFDSNHHLKVYEVFPIAQFSENTRSIIIAWTKEKDLGIPAHICVECGE